MTGIAGVLLAGGLARRMGGGDKPLKLLGGQTILARVIARLRPQIDVLILNANGDPERFAFSGLEVVPDPLPDHPGPLAGVLAGMEWAARRNIPWIATVTADAPFLPRDLVARLRAALADGAMLATVRSDGQAHPPIGLWSVALAGDLRRALAGEGLRKIDIWTARHKLATVDFTVSPVDPFFNANTPEDLATAEALLASHPDL